MRVCGTNLDLRFVRPDDAGYILSLRKDERYNTHLSPVAGDVADQRAWIDRYKQREAEGEEYYFIIERRDTGQSCGLVRVYDLKDDHFTWGSWILDENKTPKAALESAFLIYEFGFEKLGFGRSVFDVRRGNERTLSFHQRFGAQKTGENDLDCFFEYTRLQFQADRPKHLEVIQAAKSLI